MAPEGGVGSQRARDFSPKWMRGGLPALIGESPIYETNPILVRWEVPDDGPLGGRLARRRKNEPNYFVVTLSAEFSVGKERFAARALDRCPDAGGSRMYGHTIGS
jgi:hypothetical protein